jgi:hypothetical protein
MLVTFSIYGECFDAYEFLLEAKELPPDVKLWDETTFDEELGNEGGFTLDFKKSQDLISIPFSFGRFLIANKELLKSEKFFSKETHKDLSIIIEHSDVKRFTEHPGIVAYILTPEVMNLLSELNISFYVTKLMEENS